MRARLAGSGTDRKGERDGWNTCRLHSRPVASRGFVGCMGRAVPRRGLRPAGAGLAGRLGDRRGDSCQRRRRRRSRDQRRRRPLRRDRAGAFRAARSRRPFLRRPDRAAPDRTGARSGRRRDRPGADQGRPRAADLGAQGRLDRPEEPVEQEQGGLADRRAVPVRLRQRDPGRRIGSNCSSAGRSRLPGSRSSRRRSRTSPRSRPRG